MNKEEALMCAELGADGMLRIYNQSIEEREAMFAAFQENRDISFWLETYKSEADLNKILFFRDHRIYIISIINDKTHTGEDYTVLFYKQRYPFL